MIEFDSLTVRYGSFTAVDDLTFRVPPGAVTGFLGPNGAGKSTGLGALLGLITTYEGRATFDGVPFRELAAPARTVGALLSASAFHPGRTGRDTLALAALATGAPRGRVAEVLERVGLAAAAGKRVGTYSLGMRQRLGIAHVLLGDPAVLVLDEPANGLDPDGIRWLRHLLQDHAHAGGTVLVSSHLLAEMQLMADRVVVIDHGRLVTEGTVPELLGGAGLVVAATDPAALTSVLDRAALAHEPWRGSDERLVGAVVVDADAERIGRLALETGLVLTHLAVQQAALEDVFLDLTHAAPEGARA